MSLIIDVLYYIFTFPRLIFSYVGYNPYFPFLIASRSELDQLEFDGQSETITSQLSTVFTEEEDSLLGFLIPSISCYFPAVLKFGAVKYDMTLISLLVISAFVAVLTSSFVLLIIALYPTTFYSWIPKWAKRGSNNPMQGWANNETYAATMRKIFEASAEPDIGHPESLRSKVGGTGELTIHRSQRSMHPEYEIQSNALESLLQIMKVPYNVLKSDKLNIPVISLDGSVNIGYEEALTFIQLMFPVEFSQISISAECQIQAHFIKLHVFHHIGRLLYQGTLDKSSNTRADVTFWEDLLTSVDILATVLGDKLNYVGDGVTEIDVVVFAAIDQILRYCPKEQNATYLLQEFPNLCSWFARITEEILSCKNPNGSDTSDNSSPSSGSSDSSRNSSRSQSKLNDSEGKLDGSLDVQNLIQSSGDYHSSKNDGPDFKSYIEDGYSFCVDTKTAFKSDCSHVFHPDLEENMKEMPEFNCFSEQKPIMGSSVTVHPVQLQ